MKSSPSKPARRRRGGNRPPRTRRSGPDPVTAPPLKTQGEHLLAVLRTGTVSTNAFLAEGSQLRGGHELAARYGHSPPAMARHPLQGETRHYD